MPKTKMPPGLAPAEAPGDLTLPLSAPGGSRCSWVCDCRAPFSSSSSFTRPSILSLFSNLFLAALGLCYCAQLSLVGMSRGSSLVTEHWL